MYTGRTTMSIEELRAQTGLSQQKFADKFHMRVDNVRCWEQGVSSPLPCIEYMVAYILELEGKQNEKIHSFK